MVGGQCTEKTQEGYAVHPSFLMLHPFFSQFLVLRAKPPRFREYMTQTIVASEALADRGFRLYRDEFGRLLLVDADDRCYVGVEPARAFPISCAQSWISICNAEGHEILCIREPKKLPREVYDLLMDELARREFVPIVQRIVKVMADADPSEWHVITDRGPTTFLLDSEDDVRHLGNNKALLIDMHGIRYLIPDTRALDAASRRALSRYF